MISHIHNLSTWDDESASHRGCFPCGERSTGTYWI